MSEQVSGAPSPDAASATQGTHSRFRSRFDAGDLRRALGGFPTGVTVVTARVDEMPPVGMTVSSFNAVSLDPPLVLFSIDRRARSLNTLRAADGYAVNVLAAQQEDVSNRFAQPGADKWEATRYTVGVSGAPLLQGVATAFDCYPYAEHDGGDHVIFVGRVVALLDPTDARPLLFHRGRYASLDDGSRRAADPVLEREWPLAIHY